MFKFFPDILPKINFGEFLSLINYIVFAILAIIYFHHNLFLILAIFFKKKAYPEAKENHYYGFIISARNEEQVIANLIESIKQQDYPTDKYKIYVIADNCLDNTASIAKEHGAIVIERHNTQKIGKSYALDEILKYAINDEERIEAFIVFDADNVVDKNFTKEMNKAFDAGNIIATSFRNSKNYGSSWVASGTGMTFFRECRVMHRMRSRLNMTTYVSGTGFLVSKQIIIENGGWVNHLMIEDVEFSIDEWLKGYKVAYVADAIMYDEHPKNFKDSFKQRMRWCKGNHQCFHKFHFKLFKNGFKRPSYSNIDLYAHTFPASVLSLGWLGFVLPLSYGIYAIVADVPFNIYFEAAVRPLIDSIIFSVLYTLVVATIVTILCWKDIKAKASKKILHIFTFPLYALSYLFISFISIFAKAEWKPIKHTDSITIEDIEKDSI